MISDSRMRVRFGLTVAALVFWVSAVSAQDNGLAGRLRALNAQLLQLHGLVQNAGAGEAAALRSQAAPVIEQRAQALSALIQQNTREALTLAFSEDLLADLGNSFPASAGRLESHGAWEGVIDYLVTMDFDLVNYTSSRKMHAGSELLEIHFAGTEPNGLKSGDRLSVQGVRAGNQVAAANGNITASADVAGAACSTIGGQNVAAIMVNFPNYSLSASITQDLVKGILLGNAYAPTNQVTPDRSIDSFWKEGSDGKTYVEPTGTAVLGPYTLSSNYNTDATGAAYCDYNAVKAAAIAAADPSVNFLNFSRLLIVMPPNGACSWAGLGTLGCSSNSSPQDGSFTASSSWLRSDQMSNRGSGVQLFSHELGHNLTLHHSSTREFGAETLGALGTTGTLDEYGDRFATMGSWNYGHYNAHHAASLLNWLAPTTNYQVVQASGTFTIENYERRPAGLKALKILRGTGNNAWLWVEYRQNSGIYDSAIGSQVWDGALIHYQDSATGTHTHLLDFYQPASNVWSDPALPSGSTWVDSYSNVSIAVVKNLADPMKLDVTVTYGPLPCNHANPTISISPLNPSVIIGTPVNYTVTVTNNDSAGCASRTFNLTSSQPAGWGASFSAQFLTLAPAGSGPSTLTVTPTSGESAMWPISATATNSLETTFAATATANCTVLPVPPPITSSVGTDKLSYAPRSTVKMTATVASGINPVSGASMKFTLTRGTTVSTKTVTTVADGTAVWNYRLSPKDPNGPYTLSVLATYGTQTATATTAVLPSFTVAP